MATLKPNDKALKAAIAGARARYTLAKHPGLILDTRGDGNGSWRIRYRTHKGGPQHWHTISNDARNADFAKIVEAAATHIASVKLSGTTTKPGEPPLESCFNDWMVYTGRRRRRALADETADTYRRLFRLYLANTLGPQPINAITKADVQAAVKAAYDARDVCKGERGLQATKALKLLSSICEWAIDREHIDRNPCRGVDHPTPEQNPAGKQSRPPTNAELRQLWNDGPALMHADKTRVLRLCILLGRRISEISRVEASDLCLDQSTPVLVIPADRKGNKSKREDLVPLPPIAADIFRQLLTENKQPFMGIATRREEPSKALMAVRRAWGWPGQVRFHDLRGLVNDQLSAIQVPREIRSRIFAHYGDLSTLVDSTYSAFDFLQEKLRALELWEQRLGEIVRDDKPSGLRW